MKAFKVLFLLVFGAFFASAQENAMERPKYPDQGFRAPLDIPLRLSGSFGELRSNHFHSGIDFKTQGRTGIPLKAIQKGYVARIKVSSTGFGKALYINHPNGYTSVYAHIKRFQQDIEQFIKRVQYERESYEVQVFPNSDKFRFDKGDVIAYSGNSGSSRGPHLHFEVRDTKSEEPINPLFFGFGVKDNRAPVIRGVQLYPKGQNSAIQVDFTSHSRSPVTSHDEPVELDVKKGKNGYVLDGVREIRATGKIGVGVEAYDYHGGSGNPLGVYKITLKKGGKLLFQSTIDRFPFYKTRYLNAHIDYGTKKKTGDKYQRCFVLPGNRLSFYETFDNGYFHVSGQNRPDPELVIKDTYGNASRLSFDPIKPLDASSATPHSQDPDGKVFPYNRANSLEKKGIRLNFPVNAFYDTVYFRFDRQKNKEPDVLSSVYQVHDPYTPVHKYYNMAIKADEVPRSLRNKAVIVNIDEDGDEDSEGGSWDNGYIETKTRSLGEFCLKVDTVAPEIVPLNVEAGKIFTEGEALQIRIKDALAGIESYRPEIDGNWARMAYDEKNDLLTYRDFGDLASGTHELSLRVTDEKGNRAVYNVEFTKN